MLVLRINIKLFDFNSSMFIVRLNRRCQFAQLIFELQLNEIILIGMRFCGCYSYLML